MKLTLSQIEQAYAACTRIKDEKLNIKTAYQLLKLVNELEVELKNFEEFTRNLILEYCEKDEDGKPITTITEQGEGVTIPENNRSILQEKIQELNLTQIDIKDYNFTFTDFENISISISELSGFLPFISDEE